MASGGNSPCMSRRRESLPEGGGPGEISSGGAVKSRRGSGPRAGGQVNSGTAPPPVDVETFARDELYWGMGTELYSALVPALVELNSGKYVEAVLTGGIGCGKT